MPSLRRWIPAGALCAGCLVNGGVAARQSGPVPLRAPIASIAPSMLGIAGVDQVVGADERRVAGMSSYILRNYDPPGALGFSIYVGYYDEQRQGKTIHSPKNCLPGAGWDPVDHGVATIPSAAGPVIVNRYLVANGKNEALVYYWYQGRGRVAHDEFRVKYELLRDAVLYGRTEEALVRIVVPVTGVDTRAADQTAVAVAAPLMGQVDRVLPRL